MIKGFYWKSVAISFNPLVLCSYQNVCVPVGGSSTGIVVELKSVSILLTGWYREADSSYNSASADNTIDHRSFNDT